MNPTEKKCLLIIPKHFYSFQKHFYNHLSELGFTVTISNDEYPDNTIGKILGKLRLPLRRFWTRRYINNKFIINSEYQLVLIFKGRGVDRKLIEMLRKVSPQVIAYNWDSFKFNPCPLEWYKLTTKYCTFDHKDSLEKQIPLVELFTTINLKDKNPKNIRYNYSAVFRNHSGRLKYLDEIVKRLDIDEDDIFIYIFEHNIFYKIYNFLKNPLVYLKYKEFIHSTSLSYDKYLDVLTASEYTIDYAHPHQTGVTMRCFDALNTKTKIITNNPYILESVYFKDSSPIVFDGSSNLDSKVVAEHSRQKLFFQTRTIEDFFSDLLA